MVRWTEEQLQQHKTKRNHIVVPSKMINKKRNKQPEEDMKKEFYQLMCLKLPKEVEFLYRIEPFAFRKLITKQNAGIAMGISKQLQNTGYQKGEFDYEFRKRIIETQQVYQNTGNSQPIVFRGTLFCSLHIEFKHGKNKLTPEQEAFKKQQEEQGRKCVVCYSADEGVEAIKKYLRGEL